MSRYIDNEDISKHSCYIKFLTPDGKGDRYPVFDIIAEVDTVYFKWVIDSKVTRISGKVQFAVAFETIKDNKLLYNWQTVPTSFNILSGLKVDELISDQYPTLLQQWLNQFESDKSVFYNSIVENIVGDAPENMNTIGQVVNSLNTKVEKVENKQLSTNDFTNDEKTKLNNLKNYDDTEVKDLISNKVDIIEGKGLSENNFTDVEKEKLAGLDDNHFKGTFTTKEVLDEIHPISKNGDYAYVGIAGTDESIFIWDSTDSKWIPSGNTSLETPATIKSKYESNADTNAYTDVDKNAVRTIQNKLDKTGGIVSGNITLSATPTENNHVATKGYVDGIIANVGGGGGTGSGSNDGIIPSDVSGIEAIKGNKLIKIKFNDPTDEYWKGTKIVRKAGAPVKSLTDGVLVLDNQERGKYATTAFIDDNLMNDTTYYYHFFPYSEKGAINTNATNKASETPVAYGKMGVKIDHNNTNPQTSTIYIDEAISVTPRSDEWDDFFGHYPCLLKNGVEVGKLDKNNFNMFEDGTPADIVSGDAGDVMIAFPRRGLIIDKSDNTTTVRMCYDPNDTDFEYLAHEKNTVRKEVFYLGAYKGIVKLEDNIKKLRSLSNQVATREKIANVKNNAKNNGDGYNQIGFYQFTYIQAMYLLKYKNLDSQTAIGLGLQTPNIVNTGENDKNGMDFGDTEGLAQMKLFGLEYLWGYEPESIGKIINTPAWSGGSSGAEGVYTTTGDDEFYTINWIRVIQYQLSGYGWVSDFIGQTKTGFLPSNTSGSETTYTCDYVRNSKASQAFIGSQGKQSGIWGLCLEPPYNASIGTIGYGRLMYL